MQQKCKAHCVLLTRSVFDKHYANKCKSQMYAVPQDGVVVSITSLLNNHMHNRHSKHVGRLLLSTFQ